MASWGQRLDPAGISEEAEKDGMPRLSPGRELEGEANNWQGTTASLLQQVFSGHALR